MNILMIADPIIPVPPKGYGGSERGVDMMCRGLTSRGHRVHLMAGPGSKDYGGGLTVHQAPGKALASRAARKIWFQRLLMKAVPKADLVINHGRLDYLEYLFRTAKPALHWFHNPLVGNELNFVTSRRGRGDHFVGISRSQVSLDKAPHQFEVIHNAVDLSRIPFIRQPESPPYLLFLGRLTPNKGVHLAIEVARRAGMRLVIAGNVPRESDAPDYFEQQVQPHLGANCEWVGPYDELMRNRLLAGAAALLFPIQWQEPFGNVMIEAMAAGVPVIASNFGSVPEVVVEGETGFVCRDLEQMVSAVSRVAHISRERCRLHVAEKFSELVFLDSLERLIGKVTGKS